MPKNRGGSSYSSGEWDTKTKAGHVFKTVKEHKFLREWPARVSAGWFPSQRTCEILKLSNKDSQTQSRFCVSRDQKPILKPTLSKQTVPITQKIVEANHPISPLVSNKTLAAMLFEIGSQAPSTFTLNHPRDGACVVVVKFDATKVAKMVEFSSSIESKMVNCTGKNWLIIKNLLVSIKPNIPNAVQKSCSKRNIKIGRILASSTIFKPREKILCRNIRGKGNHFPNQKIVCLSLPIF